MIATVVYVLIALLLLAGFAYTARRRRAQVVDLDRALTAVRSLDTEAFRNLLDPHEETYLRTRLSPADFRRIKRERALAALAYVRELSRASLEFARYGSAVQHSADAEIAASGKQIANSAIHLRLRALEAAVQLVFAATFPGLEPRSFDGLAEQYDRATHLLVRHNGLRQTTNLAA